MTIVSTTASSSLSSNQQKLSASYVTFLRHLSGSWSSHSAAKMLTPELIEYIRPRFHRCSTPLKVRILTSTLYIGPELLSQCSAPLCLLLHNCETDRDDWERKLSRLLQPYVATGHLDVRDIDTETAYRAIKYLDEQRRLSGCVYRLKPSLEDSKVFNINEDDDCSTSATAAASHLHPDSENKTHHPMKATTTITSSGNLSTTTASAWSQLLGSRPEDVLPRYRPETHHFSCGGDFSLFMQDIQVAGLAVITRELRQLHRHS